MLGSTKARAIGIIRVSQRDDETSHSPETQARAMLKLARDRGWLLRPDDILDENDISNGNVSGGADLSDRPGLCHAVEAIERGEAGVIVAERFDRFFRDLDVQREVISRVEAAGGRMVTAAGEISHATAEAELNANLNGSIAQYMRRTAKERSWAAVEVAIEEGKIPWSQTAPGYTRRDGRLAPDPGLRTVVADAFATRLGGATIEEVRSFLRSHGIERSIHGTTHLLRDRLYLGEIHFGSHTPNLQAHEPIVEREVFDAVQRMVVPRGRRGKSDRLLARLGVLRCAECNARMTVVHNKAGYASYRCPSTDHKPRPAIAAHAVEDLVAESVKSALDDLEGRASTDAAGRQARADADRAQDALDSALHGFAAAGVMREPSAIERLAELREARDRTRECAERMADSARALTVTAAKDWHRLTLEEQRGLVRAVVERVQVGRGRGLDRVAIELFSE
jgi:DNA invertase Pin-like site-specific DNA recombinase